MANPQYYSIFTTQGLALLREAIQNGTKLGITAMSFGDGNGLVPEPDAEYKKLVNEVYTTQLNRLAPSQNNPNWLEADAVIPSAIGGFNIREVGLWAGNVLVAYANYPATYKPSADQGTAQIKTIRIVLQIDNTANFELKIDASVVMATIQSVEEAKQDAIKYSDQTKTHTINTMLNLNDISEKWEGRTVYVKGYHAPENLALAQPYRGGGTRIYNANRKNENDGFLCINGWELQIENNIVTPEQAGAKGDGVTDDYEAFTRLLRGTQIDRSKGLVVQLAKATYVTTKPIEMYGAITLRGSGYGNSIILKKTASKSGITGRTDPFNNPYDYDKDAAVIFASWHGWYGDIHLQDFTIKKEAVNGVDVGYALLMPFIMQSNFTNVQTLGGEYGIWCEDAWMINWNRVKVTAKGGWYIGTGTSHSFHSCWVTDVKQGYSAYRFNSLTYSTMTSCGADRIGELGKPADAVYHITNSDITLISCAAEDVHANNILRTNFSWVTFICPTFRYGIQNNYKNLAFPGLFNVTNSDSVLKIIGGRLDTTNGESAALPIYVHDGTLSYDQVLWSNVGFPDDVTTFKISYGNDSAILNLRDFQGRVYTKSRLKSQTEVHKTTFTEGILGNGGFIDFSKPATYAGFSHATADSSYHGAGFSVGKGSDLLQVASDAYAGGMLKFRVSISDSGSVVFSPWATILNSMNTTVTADGTIKKASPIVKLFSDHIECNYEAEDQNPIFEKVGVGHYLVKNTLGFAQEGWWIEMPSDSNGNKICAIKYQTLENGDIEVKTYKRKFDVETASIIADEENPMDIPENMNGEKRWIDIRLHQIKKEIIESVG